MTEKKKYLRRAIHDKQNPYLMVKRTTAQDKRLSYEARGMLVYILSQRDDWRVQPNELMIEGCGRDKVYRILKELMKLGYVEHEKSFDNQHKIIWGDYIVHEYPQTENPDTENQEMDLGEKPFPENPDTEKPHSNKYPKKKPVSKDNTLRFPDSHSKWQWKHIEAYALEHPTLDTLACCDNTPMVKNLPTLAVARDCVELFVDLNRNGVVPHQYIGLCETAEKDTSTAKYNIFRRMIYALPNWLKTAKVMPPPKVEVPLAEKPLNELSSYEIQLRMRQGMEWDGKS